MPRASGARHVFINCPFDAGFITHFQAMVFAVAACRFQVRCARELNDAGEQRIDKIYRLIEQSRYGIHDLSRTELDPVSNLPRFNMPFELGLFLAAKRFGGHDHETKRSLAFDVEPHRYQKFISDLAGTDIEDHGNDPRVMVEKIRNWLSDVSRRKRVPPTARLLESYDEFVVALPAIAEKVGLVVASLHYGDLLRLIDEWVKSDPRLVV
ncbi:MAG: hypothetical protein V4659_11380 [Pseudomonadota bacterium]